MTKDKFTAKTILESIPEAVFMVDGDQNITFINAAAAELAGTTLEKAIGKKCGAIFKGREAFDLGPCLGKKPTTVEAVLEIEPEPGAIRHLSLRASPVKGADPAALAVIQDASHVHELEARADEMHDSSMELALGISECFGVLEEVERGNLKVRVGESTLASSDELMASLARALNKTIEGVDGNIETINRMQQMVIQELSTPLLQIWEGVLVLPVIGVVDTRRSAQIMERMLAEIVARQARYVILDITGVEVVDTRTADHFIKVVKASSLLGARCIITGIRPAVAQTLVDIGVDLSKIKTLGNLREGLAECIRLLEKEKRTKAVQEEGK